LAQQLNLSALRAAGFTLVELAVVLLIIGLLLGGLVVTVSAQLELQHTAETRQTLDNVRDALTGFAVASGRFPCPATAASNGQESPAGGGACTGAGNGGCGTGSPGVAHGFVPGVTLGVTPLDSQGYVLDGWNNRVRYSVSTCQIGAQTYPFTTANGMKTVGMGTLSTTNLLNVCGSASGATTTSCGTAVSLTSKAPAVIYSVGKNGPTGGTGADETENPNPNSGDADIVFVFHDISVASAPGGEYDDMMTWISLPVLYSRMIAAGQLP
jgi:prepilin-type N-terminal cleavage/methylation domain-containing protein